MQLKTLEDIEFKHEWNEAQKPLVAYSDDLRAEAIKWIKWIDSDLKFRTKGGYSTKERIAQINIFKTFFNISDEELR